MPGGTDARVTFVPPGIFSWCLKLWFNLKWWWSLFNVPSDAFPEKTFRPCRLWKTELLLTKEWIRLWQAWKGDGWKSVHSPLSVLIHLHFPQAKNSGEVRQVSRPKTPRKTYFTMKERSHKNSSILTGKLAPKEKEWNSLQRALNFLTSWNFVIK